MTRKEDTTEHHRSDQSSLQGSTTKLCCTDTEVSFEGPTTNTDSQLHSSTRNPPSSFLDISNSHSQTQNFTTPKSSVALLNSLVCSDDHAKEPNLNLLLNHRRGKKLDHRVRENNLNLEKSCHDISDVLKSSNVTSKLDILSMTEQAWL